MSSIKIHASSEKHTWETPQWLFDSLNERFNFTMDCCAEVDTAKVSKFFTREDDALKQDWEGVVWCNPPYGREQIKFVEKSLAESKKGSVVVLLIPARPETKVWQNIIFKEARQVCFIKGRLKFGGVKDNAPFPSALVVFGASSVDLSYLGFSVNIK